MTHTPSTDSEFTTSLRKQRLIFIDRKSLQAFACLLNSMEHENSLSIYF